MNPQPEPNAQEPPPYCRICYESHEEPRNPLLVPCDCRGSLQHIHRKCLLRWIAVDEEAPETICHLCRAPYRVAPIYRLEVIPGPRGHLGDVILKMPVLLLLIVHYILAAFLSNVPLPLRRNVFVVWASLAHATVHMAYLLLFLSMARVKNLGLYLYHWCRSYVGVPAFHYILYSFYGPHTLELGYVADLWLGAYWFVHLRILRTINDQMLN